MVSSRFQILTYNLKYDFQAIKWPNIHDLSISIRGEGTLKFPRGWGVKVVGSDLVSIMWSV